MNDGKQEQSGAAQIGDRKQVGGDEIHGDVHHHHVSPEIKETIDELLQKQNEQTGNRGANATVVVICDGKLIDVGPLRAVPRIGEELTFPIGQKFRWVKVVQVQWAFGSLEREAISDQQAPVVCMISCEDIVK